MANTLGKFQMMSFQGYAPKVTKLNHISAMFGQSPQKATDIMVELYAKNVRTNGLYTLLSKIPSKEFPTDDEYTWDVIGNTRRNIALAFARDEEGNVIDASAVEAGTLVGAAVAPFELVFTEPWFFDGEVLIGDFDTYPLRILGDGRKEGIYTVYTVELMAGNTTGMPAEYLMPGKRFSYEYAPVERELSRKVGGVRFTSPVAMRNEFTHIRLNDKVSGALFNKKIAFGIPAVKTDADGKQIKGTAPYWMHYEDWELEKTWQEYKNNVLAFSRSNRNLNGEYLNFGKSGEVIRMGDGLYAQMEVSNQHYYNHFELSLLEDVLYDLCANRLDFKDRKFVLKTGEVGAMLFNKAVLDTVSGWTVYSFNGDSLGVVSKTSSPLHANALKAGAQYTEFLGPNGVHLSLDVDPFYDDRVRWKVLDENGRPAQSSRFDIFDMGVTQSPNIFKCTVAGYSETRSYQWGPRNPWTGQWGNPNASWDEDSAEVHLMGCMGVCVLDPTRTVSLIPVELQG